MYFRRKISAGRTYLQIVESRRNGDQVRQQVIATLGRFDELQASGQLDRLVRSGARFATKAMVLSAVGDDTATKIAVRRIGPALVFERLWEETGCRAVIAELAGARGHKFAPERAIFLTVLHRLFVSGSDRAADRWREDYAIAGIDGLDLHHLYRADGVARRGIAREGSGRAHPVRTSLHEERLFAHRRDLFTRLDLVFMDTTSLYFEGAGGQTLGRHGYSKDHRPDLRQMILAVVIDGDGRPVCSEMWPGNTADVTTLIPVIERLRKRFSITRVCVIADRGMISAETLAELEARRLLYILGVRERTDKLVRELVLNDPKPFVPLTMAKRGKQVDYEAKAVMLDGQRYIVCRNHQEAAKDAHDRASIVAALKRQLGRGDKALVGNTGYRRYLKTISDEHFVIDADKVEEDEKFDGIFVLRTNTDLNPLNAMLCYKQLWMVEQTFRTGKHLLATRPIFHKLDETIRGHVFCSFLGLVLKKALEDRVSALGGSSSWPQIVADLDSLSETEIEHDGKGFVVRSAPLPAASLALRAVGVALPPTVREAQAR
jgi:hypothetical protein